MTVSYKKSGKDGGSYYTNQSSEVDDYYTYGDKEPPGVWYVAPNGFGERKTAMGIQDGQKFGSLDTKKFAALTDGFHPETGENLVQNAGKSGRVAIHDFTLSPPKSVSVVWSQANEGLKAKIEEIQSSASKRFLDYIGQKALTRLGSKGVSHVKGMLRGAMFEHGSSREGDPLLHTHSVLMGVVELENGKTGALEAREMLRWLGAAASLYHAYWAYQIKEVGFGIVKEKNLFEIAGVPEQVRDAFSQRRKQIMEAVEKMMKERGLDPSSASRAIFQIAAFDSRKKKDELTRAELEVIWRERAEALGFTEKEVNELISHDERVYLTDEECRKEVKGVVDQIMQTKAVFGEPELVAKSASAMIGKASPEQILAAIEEYKRELLVSHGEKEKDTFYTTKEMVALESELLELSEKRDAEHILEKYELPPSLIGEQRDAAEGCLKDDNYLTIVEGAAGAGKTFTMASVARAYEENGYKTLGLATSWSAALNLKREAKLDNGRAITGWLNDLKKGKVDVDSKTLILVDEGGMVSAKNMKSIIEAGRKSGAKVVVLGDRKQMASPEAGAAFAPMAEKLGTHRLDNIRRQNSLEEREAVKLIFNGKAKEGLEIFAKNKNFLHIFDNEEDLHKGLVDRWERSRSSKVGDTVAFSRDGQELEGRIVNIEERHWTVYADNKLHKVDSSHFIIAGDNKSVNDLNRLAQAKLKEKGLLEGEGRLLKTPEGDCYFHVGDEIQYRVNVYEEEVYNRTRAKITGFSGNIIHLRLDDGREKDLDLNSKDLRNENEEIGIQLAYAMTVDTSQGLSGGFSFNKDSWRFGRKASGVTLSRHKERSELFVNRQEHYNRTMKNTLATDYRPMSEFTDEEVFQSLAKSWSKEEVKATTLDYLWQTHDGALVDRRMVLAEQNALAKAYATSHTERKLKPLPETGSASEDQFVQMVEDLEAKEISRESIRIALQQGVLRVDPKSGAPIMCGRSAGGDVMQILPFEHDTDLSKNDLRGRYPPILRGDGDETIVVANGLQALKTMTNYLETDRPTPNIIITGGKTFALKGAQAKDLLAVSKTATGKEQTQAKRKGIEPSSQQERSTAKDGSSTKAREIAAARAAAEAGSRSSAAAVKAQAEMAKQAEQSKGMGR